MIYQVLKCILSQSTDPFNSKTKYYLNTYTFNLSVNLPYIFIFIRQGILTVTYNLKCDSCYQIADIAFMPITCTRHCSLVRLFQGWGSRGCVSRKDHSYQVLNSAVIYILMLNVSFYLGNEQ